MKMRLDHLLRQRYGNIARRFLQEWIEEGLVTVNNKIVTKPGQLVDGNAEIEVQEKLPQYVSRAGVKLAHALQVFNIDVTGYTILDAGLSTGGFSDCLLQHGAAKIYGVDVGTAQAHDLILQDERVEVYEKTDIRAIAMYGWSVDMVTLDLSFISVLKVIDIVSAIIKQDGKLVVLIKPQFESNRASLNKKGIVTSDKVRDKAVQDVIAGICDAGFAYQQHVPSPITGGDGNIEYLAYFIKKEEEYENKQNVSGDDPGDRTMCCS